MSWPSMARSLRRPSGARSTLPAMSEITPAPPDELRALTRLGFGELAGAAGGIGQMHAAIAGRVFRPLTATLGPIPKLVEAAHTTATASVYGALRGATTAAGRAAERAVPARRALSATPRGAAALAALNGLIGDALEREGSALQQPMAVRVGGEPILLEPDALAAAFPDAGPRLVVFLHGLMETEFAWRLGGHPTYGERLAEDLGVTPVYVRYNTRSEEHTSELQSPVHL